MITGEGRVDSQSIGGKIVGAVVERCRAADVPVHVVAGENALDPAAETGLGATSTLEATTLGAIETAAAEIATAHRSA